MKNFVKQKQDDGNAGFSIPELIIVLLIISILMVIALPRITASRRLVSFGTLPYEITSTMREARQAALTQRRQITVTYDNNEKTFVVSGGTYGAPGTWKNKVVWINGGGLSGDDIIYDVAPGISNSTLSDSTTNTPLNGDKVVFAFEGDGTVRDASDNPADNALFFYHRLYGAEGAFAVSILGVTGRVKSWHYSAQEGSYVE